MAGHRKFLFGAALALGAGLAGGALASGMGGGGGGGMPSMSAPQYNPAEEFQSGQAAYKAGKYKEAARHFEHVTEAAPQAAAGWFMLGMARAAGSDDKAAARAFEKAVKLDPSPIAARRAYAITLAKLKETDKAQAQLAELKARATACGDTCADASELKASVAEVEQALGGAAPAALLGPPSPLPGSAAGDAAYVRAVSLINESRFADALTALGAAQQALGPHPDILTYQGYVWRRLGRLDLAESYYRAALSIAPAHRGANEYYGELKVLKGDLPGARALLAKLDGACAFGCVEAEDLRRWIDHGGDPAS